MISKQQKKILAFPYTDYDALICDGAIRSGKTSLMTVAFVDWAMRCFNHNNFAICGKTVGSAIKNIIVPYLSLSYAKKRYNLTFTRSDNKLVVSQGNRTNTFYVYGGKDESSYMLIQGITLAGVFLDEVALMTRSFVEQALARCSVDGSKFWFNCNPEGPLHWFYIEWIKQADKHNALYLHFNLEDNPSLSSVVLKRYYNTYAGVFFDRYIKGLWVAAEGLIYDMLTEDNIKLSDEKYTREFVSCDYGTQNPCVFLHIKANGVGDKISHYADREYYFDGRKAVEIGQSQKTDADYVADMERFCKGDKNIRIIIDPSAASFITALRKAGFSHVTKARNDVMAGISQVSTELQQKRLLISPDCKHTHDELRGYVWDDKALERGEDKPLKINDHCADALRYGVYTDYRRNMSNRPVLSGKGAVV